MRVKFLSLRLPERQPSSDKFTDSTTSADSLKKSSGTEPFIVKSGLQNLKNFVMRFGRTEASTSVLPQQHKKRISTTRIGEPIRNSARPLKNIVPPSLDEINNEIETFWNATKHRNDSTAGVNWDGYLKATQGNSEHVAIVDLKHKLGRIDEKVRNGIAELKLTAYDNIRDAKKQFTPQHEMDAENLTRPNFQESLLRKLDPASKQTDRLEACPLTERQELIKTREALIITSAISRFKKRATEDFERNRLKDVKKACVSALKQHFGAQVPTGPLYQLVSEISPEAAIEVMSEIDLETKMQFFAEYSVVPKDDPWLTSFVASIKSEEIRELLGRTWVDEMTDSAKSKAAVKNGPARNTGQ